MQIKYSGQRQRNKEERSFQQKGSLTVECAFVLPLFFFAVVMMISILDLFRVGMRIQASLCEAVKELGMYAYCTEEDSHSPVGVVNSGICIAYGTRKVRENLKGEKFPGISGGINGISLLGSDYKEGVVCLKASFLYKSPVAFFRLMPVRIQLEAQARAWTGYHGETYYGDQEEELVYVTDWESVYHTSPSCSHLSLDIERASSAGIEARKNIYGSFYSPCERCIGNGEVGSNVFITPSGDCYHSSRDCGGLSRHVRTVKKSETEGMSPCSRCGGK